MQTTLSSFFLAIALCLVVLTGCDSQAKKDERQKRSLEGLVSGMQVDAKGKAGGNDYDIKYTDSTQDFKYDLLHTQSVLSPYQATVEYTDSVTLKDNQQTELFTTDSYKMILDSTGDVDAAGISWHDWKIRQVFWKRQFPSALADKEWKETDESDWHYKKAAKLFERDKLTSEDIDSLPLGVEDLQNNATPQIVKKAILHKIDGAVNILYQAFDSYILVTKGVSDAARQAMKRLQDIAGEPEMKILTINNPDAAQNELNQKCDEMFQGVNKGLIDVTQSLDKGNGRLTAGVAFCKYAFNDDKELENQFIGTIQECNDADAMLSACAKVPDDLAGKMKKLNSMPDDLARESGLLQADRERCAEMYEASKPTLASP